MSLSIHTGASPVIGGGLTGVSSAAHCIAHGFDVVIYDKSDRVGGIWARVNETSGVQLNSLLYHFHPGVIWSTTFPHRDEILSEIRRIWREYQLESRTRLDTEVTSVRRAGLSIDPKEGGHARWITNDGEDGEFDAVIVTIGPCGPPNRLQIDGTDQFKGKIYHSSELDDADLEGKDVVIIGSGASGVEAAELTVVKKAKRTTVLARDDKWIIPRNIVFDTTISAQPFGRQTPLSWIPETLLKVFHYRAAKDLAPTHIGLFEGTPIVNDEFLRHIREKRVSYIRGDTLDIQENGVRVNVRQRGSKPKDPGEEKIFNADVIVFATGYKKPSIDFLPKDLFPEGYERPNLYLQNFSTEDWSILMTNSAYLNAIGTV